MYLTIAIKPFSFSLTRELHTAHGITTKKRGWLIHLKDEKGKDGWGEVSPISKDEYNQCSIIMNNIDKKISRKYIENNLSKLPGSIAFALGGSLAEIDGLVGANGMQEWLNPNISSYLLPTNECPLRMIDSILSNSSQKKKLISFKWKVSNQNSTNEKQILKEILKKIPKNAKIRIDANGGWSRQEANLWVNWLKDEPKIEWIEQPLKANDIEGLYNLANKITIALDESLVECPLLRQSWKSWQIRRPALDGDPRPLLQELNQGISYRLISTAFETGIGSRWVNHLATLQLKSPTPSAPGLAPGWCPEGALFSQNPKLVWEAA